jgi:hypothetical protein
MRRWRPGRSTSPITRAGNEYMSDRVDSTGVLAFSAWGKCRVMGKLAKGPGGSGSRTSALRPQKDASVGGSLKQTREDSAKTFWWSRSM